MPVVRAPACSHRQFALPIEQLAQAAAGQVLHNHIKYPGLVAQGVDSHNIGMPHLGNNPGFLHKTLEVLLILQPIAAQLFNGHPAIEQPVFGFVHFGKAALAQRADHFKLKYSLAGFQHGLSPSEIVG
jgi:hypothetical protein